MCIDNICKLLYQDRLRYSQLGVRFYRSNEGVHVGVEDVLGRLLEMEAGAVLRKSEVSV